MAHPPQHCFPTSPGYPASRSARPLFWLAAITGGIASTGHAQDVQLRLLRARLTAIARAPAPPGALVRTVAPPGRSAPARPAPVHTGTVHAVPVNPVPVYPVTIAHPPVVAPGVLPAAALRLSAEGALVEAPPEYGPPVFLEPVPPALARPMPVDLNPGYLAPARLAPMFAVPAEPRPLEAPPEYGPPVYLPVAAQRGVLVAQLGPGVTGVPQGVPSAPVPSTPSPEPSSSTPSSSGTPSNSGSGTPSGTRVAEPPKPPRQGRVYVDTRFGFDRQSTVQFALAPLQVEVTRRIRTLAVTAEYPLADKTSVALSVPYIHQSTQSTAALLNRTISRTGQGVGDIGVYLQQQVPDVAKGTSLTFTAGLQLPTGKDPFNVGAGELPTGIGFYQALARAAVSKTRVPLNFYGAIDYGKAISTRRIAGQKVTLPDSYGAEAGFYYTLGPEFTVQTALSWNRLSSPFILGRGATVAYLSQSLTYNAGKRTLLRGSVDLGLTEESTDAFVGLSLDSTF